MSKPPLAEPANSRDRLVVMLAFEGGNLIDVAGPLQAFATANELRPRGTPGYRLLTVSQQGGQVTTGPGLPLLTTPLTALAGRTIDTLIVPGGLPPQGPMGLDGLIAWLARNAHRPRRLCSVCTGAFLLADAGLLDGRRCATHWSRSDELQLRHPALQLDPDAIFVRDGNIWTSGGVTAGIDLALALVEEDHGFAIAKGVAQHLVVYHRRHGGQSQFAASIDLAPNAEALTVERLAGSPGMSFRQFTRAFRTQTGTTPGRAWNACAPISPAGGSRRRANPSNASPRRWDSATQKT